MSAPVRIGTSGWQYRHWAGDFYPAGLPQQRWLERYVQEFDTVELNNPFYRLPDARVFTAWGRRVPAGFRFAVKASRYLTHVRRLSDPDEPLERLWSRARCLGNRLGPVLYQLPPRWKPNHERLSSFLAALPDAPQAIEFRDRSWYVPVTFALLAEARVALCLHDMADPARRGAYTALSDERDKTDIEELGVDPLTGLPMYAYRYKDDPKDYPKIVGPMAQDIEKMDPRMVREIGGHKVVSIPQGGLM